MLIWVKELYDPAKDLKRLQYEFHPDPGDTSPLIQEVQTLFEGREAIYIEKGAIRVRVSNICGSASRAIIAAEVEEIRTPGLGVGSFCQHLLGDNKPVRRWNIDAGFCTSFSDQEWDMGYGGWSLYFHPKAVEGVTDMAARFPANLDSSGRYTMILHFLQSGGTFSGSNSQRVFQEMNHPPSK